MEALSNQSVCVDCLKEIKAAKCSVRDTVQIAHELFRLINLGLQLGSRPHT